MLPVGSTVPDGGFTVAVNVTVWFTTDPVGSDEINVVTAAVLPTVSVIVGGAATVKFVSLP
jgi:hypothetical protein